MDGRGAGEESYSIWMDEADDDGADAVGVDGAEGYECRRSTYAVEMSGEGYEGWISGRTGYKLTLYEECAQQRH